MDADPEISITVSGIGEVTGDLRDWASVSLSDSLDGHAALSFTCRYQLGSAVSPVPYADVRAVNLLTGLVLFEGLAVPGPVVDVLDPGIVDVTTSAVSLSAMAERSRVQADVSLPEWLDAYSGVHGPLVADMVPALLRASLADPRMARAVTVRDSADPVLEWAVDAGAGSYAWSQARGASLAQALSDMMDGTRCQSASGGGFSDLGHILKWHAGTGWVAAVPTDAWRGASGLDLSTAHDGMPARSSWTRDDGELGSAALITESTLGTEHAKVIVSDTSATNGWLAFTADIDATGSLILDPLSLDEAERLAAAEWRWAQGGNSREYREAETAMIAADILVGHSVTWWEPHSGTVTGTVQSVQTEFLDGVDASEPAAWPELLDAGLSLDGSWALDAARSRVIPRRMRAHTITVTGRPRGLIADLRASGSI
jgi:hypothetical protein